MMDDITSTYVLSLVWERPGVPQESLESVSKEREVWVSLLDLLPPSLDYS